MFYRFPSEKVEELMSAVNSMKGKDPSLNPSRVANIKRLVLELKGARVQATVDLRKGEVSLIQL